LDDLSSINTITKLAGTNDMAKITQIAMITSIKLARLQNKNSYVKNTGINQNI
jgi:hypothetical protein